MHLPQHDILPNQYQINRTAYRQELAAVADIHSRRTLSESAKLFAWAVLLHLWCPSEIKDLTVPLLTLNSTAIPPQPIDLQGFPRGGAADS